MMLQIYSRKKKKKSPTKKQVAEYQAWLDSINSIPLPSGRKGVKLVNTNSLPTLKAPPGRETKKYPSLGMGGGNATKPIHGKVYTGTAMIGIGTLHKSNAVPIFTDEEAKDQATMRR